MIFMITFWIREHFLVDRNQFQIILHSKENLLADLGSWMLDALVDTPVTFTWFSPQIEFLLLEGEVD